MIYTLLAAPIGHPKLELYTVPALMVLVMIGTLMRYFYWPAFLWGGKKAVSYDTSILLKLYAEGRYRKISTIADGETGGTHYSVLEVLPTNITDPAYMGPLAYIYVFNLGFHTEAHIIGFGRASFVQRLDGPAEISEYKVEKVSLEGDFNDYFSVFCAPGQQIKVRTIFSPDNMEIFADYVKSYAWEVIGDKVYVISGKLLLSTEDGVIKETNSFIKDIRPNITITPAIEQIKQ